MQVKRRKKCEEKVEQLSLDFSNPIEEPNELSGKVISFADYQQIRENAKNSEVYRKIISSVIHLYK